MKAIAMKAHVHTLTALAALTALTLPASAAYADATAGPREHCFLSRDWQSWTAPASGKGDVLYLRVNLNDVYRVELTPGSYARKYPGSFLVNQVRGSNWICSALDLDLSISDNMGFRQPLIARSLERLTPTEIAAIPKRDRP